MSKSICICTYIHIVSRLTLIKTLRRRWYYPELTQETGCQTSSLIAKASTLVVPQRSGPSRWLPSLRESGPLGGGLGVPSDWAGWQEGV